MRYQCRFKTVASVSCHICRGIEFQAVRGLDMEKARSASLVEVQGMNGEGVGAVGGGT